jgi:hypothetical protein
VLDGLSTTFKEAIRTHGWPGHTQYRFAHGETAILIWSSENQADWFVAAKDESGLEAALVAIWELDEVGKSFYETSPIGKAVLERIIERKRAV